LFVNLNRPFSYYTTHSTFLGLVSGRKKRIQYLVLFFSIFSIICGIVLLGVGCSSGSHGFLAGLFLFLLLGTVGGGLFVFYLRAIGRLNLPCWPSRAARISKTLIQSGDDPAASAATRRSATQLTLAESVNSVNSVSHERSKLMEEEDTIEADKIAESGPKIVLIMDSNKLA
jgi:hypothetical protein